MRIVYEPNKGKTTAAEANTEDELIKELKLDKAVEKKLRSELPENFDIHDIAMYLYIELSMEVIEVSYDRKADNDPTSCCGQGCGCHIDEEPKEIQPIVELDATVPF